jgi:membrane-bound lytic murein transglycosylase MltF
LLFRTIPIQEDPLRLFRLDRAILTLGLLGTLTKPAAVHAQTPPPAKAKTRHELPTISPEILGDFDVLKKRRLIRVLVVYNKTNYFIDKGQPRGVTYEAFKLFEDDLNKKYKTGNLKIHVAILPVARADLAELLLKGRGDIAAANITVTPERLQKVDFSNPTVTNVSEIVVSGPASQPITAVDDLSGREVFVRKGSIYNESLDKLNADLGKRGKPP